MSQLLSPSKSKTEDTAKANGTDTETIRTTPDASTTAKGAATKQTSPDKESKDMSTKENKNSKSPNAPAPSAEQNRVAAARAKNLDLAISQIQKDYGDGAIMRLGEHTRVDVDVIPTGNLLIDRALGVGGFPRGRIIEVYGPESSGKTTLTLTVIAQAQKMGGLAGFVDVEHALDPQYSKLLGVNLDELLVSQPSSGEEALRIVETLLRSNALDVIVLDSVAALVTKQELDGEIGDSTVGAQARLMSAAMRKLTSLISKARTTVIFTNQIREKIGVMFGNPETTPGGRALKFYSSVRCDIRRIGAIKSTDGTMIGNRTRLKVVKNKVAPPYGEAEFDIMFNEGISAVGSLLDLAIEHEILQKRGSWFSYKGTQLAQGRDAAKDALKADEQLYKEIEKAVKAKMDGNREEEEA
jgi:recombination protein RecA